MTVEGLSIEEVTEDDLLELAELKALDDAEATQSKVDENRALERVMSFYSGRIQMWIARLDSDAVGYWMGAKEANNAYRSNGIFVREKARGIGIGTELKKSQVTYATDAGFKEIYSTTRNEHARKILVALGFQYDETHGIYYLPL